MSTTAQVNLPDLPEGVQVAASDVETFATVADTVASESASFLKSEEKRQGIIRRLAVLSCVIEYLTKRDGSPSWGDKAGDILSSILTAHGMETTDVQRVKTAIRVERWRTIRPLFVLMYVLTTMDSAERAKIGWGTPIPQWNAVTKGLPDAVMGVLDSLGIAESAAMPATGYSTALKNAAYKEFKRSDLDVPDGFLGFKKDRTPRGTQDKNASPGAVFETALGAVSEKIGEEGGLSFAAVAEDLLRINVAFAAAVEKHQSNISDRPKVQELHAQAHEVSRITGIMLASKHTPEDLEKLHALSETDPKNKK